MSKNVRLTLEKTFLYDKNDVCIRYEVYTDKSAHSFFVDKIVVKQEDGNNTCIVDKIDFDWQSEQSSGFQRQVQLSPNPGPLQVATSDEYCDRHFKKNYT